MTAPTVSLAAALLLSAATPALAAAPGAPERAIDLIRDYGEVIEYCEPCGDLAPGEPLRVSQPARVHRSAGRTVLVVEGREMALEHTYVRTEPGWFRNLALLVGLEAGDQPPSLRVRRATDTGELITPSREAPPPLTLQARTELATPAAVATPETVLIHVHQAGPPWIALAALALSGTAVTGLLALLVAARARRRRTVLPRAIGLAGGDEAARS
jgi:hypothetical protein